MSKQLAWRVRLVLLLLSRLCLAQSGSIVTPTSALESLQRHRLKSRPSKAPSTLSRPSTMSKLKDVALSLTRLCRHLGANMRSAFTFIGVVSMVPQVEASPTHGFNRTLPFPLILALTLPFLLVLPAAASSASDEDMEMGEEELEWVEVELPPPREATTITVWQKKKGGPVLVRKVMGRWLRSEKGSGLAEGDEIVRMGEDKEMVDARLSSVRHYIQTQAAKQRPLHFSIKKKTARNKTPTYSQDSRKTANANSQRRSRANEPAEKTKARLRADAEATAQARGKESDDQREARLRADAKAKERAREKESAEQREQRLEKERERSAKRRAEETHEERLLSLMKLRERMRVVRKLRSDRPDVFEKETEDILVEAKSYRDTLSEEGKELYKEEEARGKRLRRQFQSEVETMLRLLNQVEKHITYNAAVALGVAEVNVLKRARNDDSMAAVTVSQFHQIQLFKKRKREEQERARKAKAAEKNAFPIADIAEGGERERIRKELCDLFEAELRGSAIHPCLSCEQLKNRGSLHRLNQKKLDDLTALSNASPKGQSTRKVTSKAMSTAAAHFKDALQCLISNFNELGSLALLNPDTYGTPDKPVGWVCNSCWGSLKAGLAPALGTWNNLAPTSLPEDAAGGKSCLSQLEEVGRSLIARRILYRRIMTLPAGGQLAVKGGIVNVPTNLQRQRTKEQMEEQVFPLTPEEAEVQVETKRRVGDKRKIRRKILNLRTVIGATHELHAHNPLYSDIKMRSEDVWRAAVEAEDSELLGILEGDGEDEEAEESGETEKEAEDTEERDPLLDVLLACVDGPPVSAAEADAFLEKEAESTGGTRHQRRGKKKAFVVAPGEGETPIPLFMDKDVEPLAMPWLFPLGENHFSSKRAIPITRSQYIKNRLLHRDSRWREDSLFPYYAFYALENERLIRSVSVNMQKATAGGKEGKDVTAGALEGDGLGDFLAKDKAFRYMKSSRGSPAYWNSSLLDLMGMIRQLGAPTWFVTLSADDRNWADGLKEAFKLEHHRIPSDEEVTNMSGGKRNELLRKHGHVFARKFHSRVQAFSKVTKSKFQPLGKVVDYYYRVEWQKRGSPHIHGLLWAEDAPKLGEASDEEVAAWIDKHVDATIPTEEENKELHDLVVNLQTHNHRPSCQREGITLSKKEEASCKTPEEREKLLQDKRCRFKYPRPQLEKTTISYSDGVKEQLATQEALAAAELAAEKERMVSQGRTEEEIQQMEAQKKEEAAFTRARIIQTSPVEINLKRGPNDVKTNNYNKEVLSFWQANMDIQYVGNVYAAAQYIAGYVAKAERALAQEVKDLAAKLDKDVRTDTRWRKIACAFIKSRTISSQEVTHNILGLPYLRKSRRCIYIPSGLPRYRHRKLKNYQDLQALPADSADVFVRNVIEHYENRACCHNKAAAPDRNCYCSLQKRTQVEQIPLITFAAYYTLDTGVKQRPEDQQTEEDKDDVVGPDFEEGGYMEEDDEDDEEHLDLDAMKALPEHLYESVEHQSANGTPHIRVLKYRKRKKQAVVRFHHFNPDTETETWAYSNILLFFPFRNEGVDLDLDKRQRKVKVWVESGDEDGSGHWVERPADTHEEWFRELIPSLQESMSQYAAFAEMIAEAMRNLEANKELAYALQQGDLERAVEGDDEEYEAPDIDFLREMLNPGEDFDYDPFDQAGVPVDGGRTEAPSVQNPFVQPGETAEDVNARLQTIKAKLNEGQTTAFRKACQAMDEYDAAVKDGKPYKGAPIFISGAGGCGKSFVIEAITLEIQWRSKDLDKLNTLILASTGAAAVLLGGTTVHTGFGIQPDKSRGGGLKSLRAQLKQSFQNKYEALRAVIIDEVSMVAQDLLYRVNERLNEIFEVRDPSVTYGGKLMFFVGDLLQLPAVRAKAIFDKEMSRKVGPEGTVLDLWREVEMVELTEVMRTRGDPKYGQVMSRVRLGLQTKEDLAYLEQRTLTNLGKTDKDVQDIMHIFPTNEAVNTYNRKQMDALSAKWAAEKPSGLSHLYDTNVKAITVIADKMQQKHFKGDAGKLAPTNINECGGLMDTLRLLRDMPVVFRTNINVADGIANGSLGELKAWVPKKGRRGSNDVPYYLFIWMKSVKGRVIGSEARDKFEKDEPQLAKELKRGGIWNERLVPVSPVVKSFLCKEKKRLLNRQQFPVAPAFASTIHKVQGATFEQLVISLAWDHNRPALAYTALSRLTSHEGLFLLDFKASTIVHNKKANAEMQELRKRSGLPLQSLPPTAEPRDRPTGNKAKQKQQQQATTSISTPQTTVAPTAASRLRKPRATATSTPVLQAAQRNPRRLEENAEWDSAVENILSGLNPGLPNFIRLKNRANYCFANSALQCLHHIPAVEEWAKRSDSEDQLQELLGDLFSGSTPRERDAKDPERLVSAFHSPAFPFNDKRQHDGTEFLLKVLSGSELSKKEGPLHCMAWYTSTCTEQGCKHQTFHSTPQDATALVTIKRPSEQCDLGQLLHSQLAGEINQANCDDCKGRMIGKRKQYKFDFDGTHCFLFLSPFHTANRRGNYERANGLIHGFDQDNITIDGTKFRAIAAAEHQGPSLNSGHYVAFLRQPDSQWLRISDAQTPNLLPHLPHGLPNILYLVLEKVGGAGEEEEHLAHHESGASSSQATRRNSQQPEIDGRREDMIPVTLFGSEPFKNLPSHAELEAKSLALTGRPGRRSFWYLHSYGEVAIFTQRDGGKYEKEEVGFRGAFGRMRKVGEEGDFYVLYQKGARDFAAIFGSMRNEDLGKTSAFVNRVLKGLPEEKGPDPMPKLSPLKKLRRVVAKPLGHDALPHVQHLWSGDFPSWRGTGYQIWKTKKEQRLKTIMGRLDLCGSRLETSFPFILVQTSPTSFHVMQVLGAEGAKATRVLEWDISNFEMVKFSTEERKFVLVYCTENGWVHFYGKLDTDQSGQEFVDTISPPRITSSPSLDQSHVSKSRDGTVSLSSIPDWTTWARMRQLPNNPNSHFSLNTSINSHLKIYSGNILDLNVDAITNAANRKLEVGGGIDEVIHEAAGPALLAYNQKNFPHGCPVGSSRASPGFNLIAKYVVHTVGPDYTSLKGTARNREKAATLLASAYSSTLAEAARLGVLTIAVPCISTGIYGFPSDKAATIAAAAVREFLESQVNYAKKLTVILVLWNKRDERDYAAALPSYFPTQ